MRWTLSFHVSLFARTFLCDEEQRKRSAKSIMNHKIGTHTIWFVSCLFPFCTCTFIEWITQVTRHNQMFFLEIPYTMSYCMMLCYKVLHLSNEVLLAHVSKRNEFVAKLCTRSLNIHKKRENLFDLISSFPNCIFAIWLRLCIRKYAKRLSFFFPCLFLSISVSSLFRVLLKFTTSFIWTTSCDILLQFLEKLSIYMNACSNFVSVVKHWKALFHAHMSSTHH